MTVNLSFEIFPVKHFSPLKFVSLQIFLTIEHQLSTILKSTLLLSPQIVLKEMLQRDWNFHTSIVFRKKAALITSILF